MPLLAITSFTVPVLLTLTLRHSVLFTGSSSAGADRPRPKAAPVRQDQKVCARATGEVTRRAVSVCWGVRVCVCVQVCVCGPRARRDDSGQRAISGRAKFARRGRAGVGLTRPGERRLSHLVNHSCQCARNNTSITPPPTCPPELGGARLHRTARGLYSTCDSPWARSPRSDYLQN